MIDLWCVISGAASWIMNVNKQYNDIRCYSLLSYSYCTKKVPISFLSVNEANHSAMSNPISYCGAITCPICPILSISFMSVPQQWVRGVYFFKLHTRWLDLFYCVTGPLAGSTSRGCIVSLIYSPYNEAFPTKALALNLAMPHHIIHGDWNPSSSCFG